MAISERWPSPIFEKHIFPAENAGNMPEIADFADFYWTFSLYFVVFSHKIIINNNIHHQEWFNWFWSPNFLKIVGTADFHRKNGISWISQAALFIFSWNFAHLCKMAIPKIRGRPIFKKHFFLAENAGNMPEKPVLWHFLEISSLVFF